MKKPFYITTPIYYPSDKLHIGHAYCTIGTDAMARYKRLRGYDVHFLTGTDEHGQKIERVAKEKNVSPKEYVDDIVASIKDLWQLMDISYDDFIRTTDEKHQKCVQKIFKKLYDQGDIYKSEYEGWYCTPCETFFTEHQLQNGNCPDCGRPVEKVREESYFFRLSKYQDRIIQYIEENPDFIQPESRKNEMLNNFLKPGLEDLAVSRTSFTWGIPVEFDPGHIVYVWVDALSNYISALGYLTDNDAQFQKFWPADVQHVGKEIIRFHTIIWPALLMALNLPLPKKVFGHGWLVIDGGKMSKSKGNVVDPKILSERYGVDAIRYFLLRDFAWGQDGNFTNEGLIQRINSDLANDLGNLLSRTVSMIEKYFTSKLPTAQKSTEFDQALVDTATKALQNMEIKMEELAFNEALSEIWTLIRRTNKYIDETAPWVLAKDEANQEILANVMYHLAESLRITAILILPFMPNTATIIKGQLQIADDLFTWDSLKWGQLPKDTTVQKGPVAFPRIDMKKELAELEKAIKESQSQTAAAASANNSQKEEITIEDFDKVEMKIGKVLECEKVKGSDKLLKSQVKIGSEVRQIVSGIAKYYTPEDMIGKKVIVVTNLKPVKLRGEISNGMILCSEDKNGNLFLATTAEDCEEGAIVK